MTTEKAIVDSIRKHVKGRGGKTYKLHGARFGQAGAPDLIGSLGGVPFVVEVKRPGGKATPLQQRQLDEWGRQGWVTGVATSVVEFEALLTKGGENGDGR